MSPAPSVSRCILRRTSSRLFVCSYTHYVPLRVDGSDVLDRIRWAREHPAEVDAIVKNMDEYALRWSTRAAAVARIAEILMDVQT